ncbi:Rhodanese-like domain-containing protein [Thamnidium elegans]|nr:Rhodanese-like domain-containing protein [Thamnidium elegans]
MAISKVRRKLIQNFLKEKQVSDSAWECCQECFLSLRDMGCHVNQVHESEIAEKEKNELNKLKTMEEYQNNVMKLKQRRGEKGSSDPISVDCQCRLNDYKVILFYRYVSIEDPLQFALDHQHYCKDMTGKVRIASEGINATLAGTNKDIDIYLNWLTSSQPFNDLEDITRDVPLQLSEPSAPRYKFFKPSEGCIHVFSDLSIKLTDEICPLGQKSVVLDKLSKPDHRLGKLPPKVFHDILSKRHQDDFLLLDTRNYYESKIGHFEGAVKPAIRKFSQFPDYIDRNKEAMRGKKILTYCTGGIRCEKATAYMRQVLPQETEIFMLDGGIHNYIEWCKSNKDQVEDPVWQGKNYVFDARQSLGLNDESIVSTCQKCNTRWDQYKKCSTTGCHLLVLLCDDCSLQDDKVFCCEDCKTNQQNGLCQCEQQRRIEELETI